MWNALAHFVQGAGDILLQYGLQGVVMGALGFVAWLQREDRRNMFDKYCEVQEKRIMEAAASMSALNANTIALVKLSDALIKGSK